MGRVSNFLWAVVLLIPASRVMAQQPPPADAAAAGKAVAATVNGEPISVAEVNTAVAGMLQGRQAPPQTIAQLQADVLAQLIDRAVVLEELKESNELATPEELNDAIEKLREQATKQGVDFAKLLEQRQLTEQQLRQSVIWQLSWAKYVQKHANDAAFKKYFDAHKRDYDGTEIRASHVLMRTENASDRGEIERIHKLAAKLRDQITDGKITFAKAAERYSAAPSRKQGGDLGFFPRRGLMVEPFSGAAFKLETGEVSPPVVTPMGVHLIRVTAIKPGNKSWSAVKDEMKGPVAQQLFDEIAAKRRGSMKIEFTGVLPHFKLGTKELVPATARPPGA